ncbi:hypothetical protein [Peptoniphilus indolicus]|uniref:hypothetical protein n=1 Tax=Peptoniphilus indolicus TaxID=33030 RepID=UPI00058B2D41|nr:hypothetical protein [Peptoniphilus indolicus]
MNKCCLDCKIRHLNCHSGCSKYQDFYRENEEIKRRKRAYSDAAYMLDKQCISDFKRTKKW